MSEEVGFREVRNFELVWLPVGELLAAAVQPTTRTEEKRVRALRKAIDTSGVVLPLLVCQRKLNRYAKATYEVLDGHRRLRVCTDLGIDYVPCVVLRTKSQTERDVLFQVMNAYNKPLQGNDRIEAWARCHDAESRAQALAAMTKFQRAQIVDLCKILGEERVIALSKEHRALSETARRVKYMQSWIDENLYWSPGYRFSQAAAAEWIIEHSQSRLIDSVHRSKNRADIRRVFEAFAKNEPTMLCR